MKARFDSHHALEILDGELTLRKRFVYKATHVERDRVIRVEANRRLGVLQRLVQTHGLAIGRAPKNEDNRLLYAQSNGLIKIRDGALELGQTVQRGSTGLIGHP
jgi:hypothetical protein